MPLTIRQPKMFAGTSLTPDQLRRLERLRNRPTLYEIEIQRADGVRALLCYGQKGKRSMWKAVNNRVPAVVAFLQKGAGVVQVEYVPGIDEIKVGDATARPTGRTQRDMVIEGNELPYVGDWLPASEGAPK